MEDHKHEMHLFEPTSLKHAFNLERKVEIKSMTTRRVVTYKYREHHAPSPNLTQLTRLTPSQIDKRSEK